MRTTVSVIIPLYRSEPYLGRTLDSVLAQTHSDFEILCVDDCSPDASAAIVDAYVRKDPRVRYLRHERNMGAPAFGRNTGLAAASGNFVTFLDHDDSFLPEKLERSLAAMEREDLDFICSNCQLINDTTGKVDMLAWGAVTGDSRAGFARRLLESNFVPPNSTLIRRHVFDQVGGFDTQLRGVDDYDLWYRIARTFSASIINEPLVTWRYLNDASISANQELMLHDEAAFYAKIAAFSDASEVEKQTATAGIRRNEKRLGNLALLGREYAKAGDHYRAAGSEKLARLLRVAPAVTRSAYAAKLRSQRRFQPISLDFSA
jgi:glycosyltransferase involved in cell wall biosynthesis